MAASDRRKYVRPRLRPQDSAQKSGETGKKRGAAGTQIIDISEAREESAEQRAPVQYVPMDAPFFMIVMALLLFGLVMVYSASYAWALNDFGNSTHYALRQGLFAVMGVAAMIAVSRIDYRFYKKLALLGLAGAVVLLGLVLVIGVEVNDAKRWFDLGVTNFQPSEAAKLAVIIFFAWFIDKYQSEMRKFHIGFGVYAAVMLPICGLLALEPHISSIMLITITGLAMIFIGGVEKRWFIMGFAGVGAVGGGALWYIMNHQTDFGYIARRINSWLDPFTDPLAMGYQTIQSLYAIGSGGLFGLGLGNSRQKQLFLPESHNDYIFSIICEELGFVGALMVIVLFGALIFRAFWIAMHARDRFGCMLVTGITIIIALQTLINIGVATNAMPVTGMSLPFFSYGGSSLVILLVEMGIILSVSRQIPVPKQG